MSVPRSIFTFFLLTADNNIFKQALYDDFKAKSKAQVEQDKTNKKTQKTHTIKTQ